jgi:hypothetical protein
MRDEFEDFEIVILEWQLRVTNFFSCSNLKAKEGLIKMSAVM